MVIFLDFYNTKEKEKKKKSTLMERFCTIDYFLSYQKNVKCQNIPVN